VLTLSGKLQYGWVAGGQDGGLKDERGNCMDALGQVMGHSGL